MNQTNKGWSFPNLKSDEICAELQGLGVACTEDLLQNPEKDREQIKRLLEHLTEICIGVTRKEMAQPAFAGLEALSYPQLHDDSVQVINSFRAISKMMDVSCVPRFGMKDLTSPASKRLGRQLSGVINFAKFREDRLQFQRELESERNSYLEKRNSLQTKHDALTKRLNALREQSVSETATIQRIEGECLEISNKINDLNSKQTRIRDESNRLKAQSNELKEEVARRSNLLEELTSQQSHLKSQIVNSPEKFRKQIIDVGQGLRTEQNDIKAAEKKIRDLMTWISNLDDAQNEVNAALDAVGDLRNEVEKEKMLALENDQIVQNLQLKRQAMNELDYNYHHLERQVARTEEKAQLTKRQAKARESEEQKAIEELHQQLLEAESFRHQIRQRADRACADSQRMRYEYDTAIRLMAQVWTWLDILSIMTQ